MENKSLHHYPATVIFTAVSDKFIIPETEHGEESSTQGTKRGSLVRRAGEGEAHTSSPSHTRRARAHAPALAWPSRLITVSSLTVSLTSTYVHTS